MPAPKWKDILDALPEDAKDARALVDAAKASYSGVVQERDKHGADLREMTEAHTNSEAKTKTLETAATAAAEGESQALAAAKVAQTAAEGATSDATGALRAFRTRTFAREALTKAGVKADRLDAAAQVFMGTHGSALTLNADASGLVGFEGPQETFKAAQPWAYEAASAEDAGGGGPAGPRNAPGPAGGAGSQGGFDNRRFGADLLRQASGAPAQGFVKPTPNSQTVTGLPASAGSYYGIPAKSASGA